MERIVSYNSVFGTRCLQRREIVTEFIRLQHYPCYRHDEFVMVTLFFTWPLMCNVASSVNSHLFKKFVLNFIHLSI